MTGRRFASLVDSLRDELPRLLPLHLHRFDHDRGHGDEIGTESGDVLASFRRQAERLHERVVHDHGVFVCEFLGATGSGKTRLLERLIERGPESEDIGVVVGDVAGDDDARRFRRRGVDVADVTTGKECHLDPGLVQEALEDLDVAGLDTLYIENVGNMVCPADFPLGAQLRVLVVSTTEGDDVVRKHPRLFQVSDVAAINKVDVAEAVDADADRMVGDVERVAPSMEVVRTSAKTGVGVEALEHLLAKHREQGHGLPQPDGREHA